MCQCLMFFFIVYLPVHSHRGWGTGRCWDDLDVLEVASASRGCAYIDQAVMEIQLHRESDILHHLCDSLKCVV